MIHMQLMHDSSEIVYYDMPRLPVKILADKLSNYPEMRALCHWHEDIELMHIVSGEMNYEVNGKTIRLTENSTLFVNAGQLHYGFSVNKADSDFICVLFHPSLLQGNDKLYRTMVEPIIRNDGIEYLLFDDRTDGAYRTTAACMREIVALKRSEEVGCEWEVMGCLHRIWGAVFRCCDTPGNGMSSAADADRQMQRNMVSYIFRHYAEPLTLEEIAAVGSVSRSKCCLIFKKYLGQSPIDFVNSYRLEKSCQQLRNTGQSITEIALNCGFNHCSYYTKLFSRKYGCTPSEYRKNR